MNERSFLIAFCPGCRSVIAAALIDPVSPGTRRMEDGGAVVTEPLIEHQSEIIREAAGRGLSIDIVNGPIHMRQCGCKAGGQSVPDSYTFTEWVSWAPTAIRKQIDYGKTGKDQQGYWYGRITFDRPNKTRAYFTVQGDSQSEVEYALIRYASGQEAVCDLGGSEPSTYRFPDPPAA